MPLPFPITHENYFDAAQGLYWYLNLYHGGQRSTEYQILSKLDYNPSRSEHGPDTEESKMIYDYLEDNQIGAQEVYDAIMKAYDESHGETHSDKPFYSDERLDTNIAYNESKMPLAKKLDDALEIVEKHDPVAQLAALLESFDDDDMCLIEELIQEAMNIYELMNKVRGVLKKIKEVAPQASTNPSYKGVEEMAFERDPNKIAKLAAGAALTERLSSLQQALEKANLADLAAELEAIMPKPGLLQRAAGAAKGMLQPKAAKAEVPGWLRTLSGVAKTLGRQ